MIADVVAALVNSEVTPATAINAYGLDITKELKPRQTLENIQRICNGEPIVRTGVWYDEFLDRVLTGHPAREWTDSDDTGLTLFMSVHAGLTMIRSSQVHEVLAHCCRQRPRHVVREWIGNLRWDGVERIAGAFERYWGVAVTARLPADYIHAASSNFFVGLVARVQEPGCQLDNMVVFEGEQGIKKSSSLRALAGDWYALASESVQSKDFFQCLQGKWLIEIGELDAFGRAEVTRVKTVISTPTDRYRPSYGRAAIDHPRQCVFAGTTNRDDWGNDDTGLRRFWPIRCGNIDVDALEHDRDQLIAEARRAYGQSRCWWAMPESTARVQADRMGEHSWNDTVMAGLEVENETTVYDVLTRILKHDASEIRPHAEREVASILYRNRWRKHHMTRDGHAAIRWVSPAWVDTETF